MAYQLGEMSAAVTLDISEFDNKMDRLPRKWGERIQIGRYDGTP